jgi:hypothetical protein
MLLFAAVSLATPAGATAFHFQTDPPDGRMAAASRPASTGKIAIEAADDFESFLPVSIQHATFTGLLDGGATPADLSKVVIEIYRVFPFDSTNPPSGAVPSRFDTPSDVAFAVRDSSASGQLTFSATLLSPTFTAANSVLKSIHPVPNQTTGGDGPVTGQEVQIDVTFTTPIDLPLGHYFFVPQVQVTPAGGNFYWLSSPRPISGAGTPFADDVQSTIRDSNLAPDWLHIGTDIVGGGPAPVYNASFSLDGEAGFVPSVPALSTLGLLALSLLLAGGAVVRMRRGQART